MDLLPHSDSITAILQKAASAEQEILNIMADAERRAAPIKTKLTQYKIALDVLRGLEPSTMVESAVPDSGQATLERLVVPAGTKESTRSMILTELAASKLPLSKQEIHERFCAKGRADIKVETIGSTLSNMLRDGVLKKHGSNRYSLAL